MRCSAIRVAVSVTQLGYARLRREKEKAKGKEKVRRNREARQVERTETEDSKVAQGPKAKDGMRTKGREKTAAKVATKDNVGIVVYRPQGR